METNMKLISIIFTKISAERTENPTGSINLNSDIQIKSIEKHTHTVLKREILKIGFEFKISYGDFGHVVLGGFFNISTDNKTIKEMISQWDNKNLAPEFKMIILNLVLQKCTLKLLQLEDQMGFPLHMQMPRLSERPKEQNQPIQDKENTKTQ